jgi:foldase protein PrsA
MKPAELVAICRYLGHNTLNLITICYGYASAPNKAVHYVENVGFMHEKRDVFKKMRKNQRYFLTMMFVFLMLLLSTACGKEGEVPDVIFATDFDTHELFRIGDESCSLPEIMVYLTTTQNQYESVYGAQIWDVSLDGLTIEDNIKENVLAKIAQIKTMALMAKQKEITLTEAETVLLGTAGEEYYQSLHPSEIELLGVTPELIQKMYVEYALAEKVYQLIMASVNPEISDDEARIVTVQQIYIRTRSQTAEGGLMEYSVASKTEALARAEEIRMMATDGEHNFQELALSYSDSETVTTSFGKGERLKPIEDAAFILATDEVSPVIEASDGFYILKCINTLNREETDANKSKIVAQRKEAAFGQEYDTFVSGLVRLLNEKLWEQVTFIHDDQVTTKDFWDIYEKYMGDT